MTENINKFVPDGIKTINIEDKDYPTELRRIKNAPKTIYYKGILPKPDSLKFAIVGTRRYSIYGKRAATAISQDLVNIGLVIVSGMAPGIDTFCHQAAVENKKPTIAVLGTGIDEKSIYPKTNIKLSRSIIETGGCLMSEYPPGTQGTKFTFPQRNRIIAGLSQGVLVVEAKEKSGSLITANYARQQGKTLFAFPGSIYSANSKGCHLLIKNGAKLVESANDILESLGLQSSIIASKKINGDNLEENLILDALKEEALYIDKIIEKTKLTPAIVSSTIATLEIKGKIKDLGANTYSLYRN